VKRLAWLLPTVALLVSGCGGGGGSGSSTTGPTYATIAGLTSATTFSTVAAYFNSNRPNTPAPIYSASAATVTFAYNPAGSIYSLTGSPAGSTTQASATFGPADYVASLQRYSQVSTTSDGTTLSDYLSFSLSGSPTQPSASGTGFTYSGVGEWQPGSANVNTGVQNFSTYVFAYGIGTQAGDLPRTGTATYAVQIFGQPGQGAVLGSGTLTVNFAAGTVALTMTPTITDLQPGQTPSALVTLTGSGTIDFSVNGFSVALTGTNYTCAVQGLFYGPQGAEAGAAFKLTPTGAINGTVLAAGALLGRKS
jgi:hypothetical protein